MGRRVEKPMHEKRLELSKCKPDNLHVYTWVLVPSKQNIVQMPSTHTARGWGVCVGVRVHTTHLKGCLNNCALVMKVYLSLGFAVFIISWVKTVRK